MSSKISPKFERKMSKRALVPSVPVWLDPFPSFVLLSTVTVAVAIIIIRPMGGRGPSQSMSMGRSIHPKPLLTPTRTPYRVVVLLPRATPPVLHTYKAKIFSSPSSTSLLLLSRVVCVCKEQISLNLFPVSLLLPSLLPPHSLHLLPSLWERHFSTTSTTALLRRLLCQLVQSLQLRFDIFN